jgi:predicted phage-related endonuclease
MVAFTIVSSTLGGLYGAFEVYKDYQSMKKRIAEYVAPDLSDLNKKMELTMQNSEKAVQYTQDIKNDLKQDIRRVEGVAESVERSQKQASRETDQSIQAVRSEMTAVRSEVRASTKEVDNNMKQLSRETDNHLKQIERQVDIKIQKALDNPLAK